MNDDFDDKQARLMRADAEHERQERFGVQDTLPDAGPFDDSYLALSPEQWKERLPLILAFVKGKSLYEKRRGTRRPYWHRVSHCAFLRDRNNYTMNPNEPIAGHEAIAKLNTEGK